MMSSTLLAAPPSSPRLLDQVREWIRAKHYRLRTEQAYVRWIKRYIFFHDKRHPLDMSKVEVEAFLGALAVERNVSATTQTQAQVSQREILVRDGKSQEDRVTI